MTIIREKFKINSNGFSEVFDITSQINSFLNNLEFGDCVLKLHSLNEKGIFLNCREENLKDILNFIDKLIKTIQNDTLSLEFYEISSFLKANMFKNYIEFVVENRKMLINNQNRVFFVDFENKKNISEITMSLIN